TESEAAVPISVAARAPTPERVVAEPIIERIVGVAQAEAEARVAVAISIAISVAVAVTRRDVSTHDVGRRIGFEALGAAHAAHEGVVAGIARKQHAHASLGIGVQHDEVAILGGLYVDARFVTA